MAKISVAFCRRAIFQCEATRFRSTADSGIGRRLIADENGSTHPELRLGGADATGVRSPDQLSGLPPSDQAKYGNDLLRTRLNLGLSYDLLFLTAAFGVTDTIDVSMALSINHAHMNGSAVTTIENPDGTPGNSFFALNAQGQLDAPSGQLCAGALLPKCASDGFSESVWGTGDLFLLGKWHFYDTPYADLATVGTLTLPTGNASDFLGFYDPTFTPGLIASKSFGPVSPHLNYDFADSPHVAPILGDAQQIS